MRDFIDELKYMCSADNTSSRGFYIFIAFAMVALLLGCFCSIGLIIVNLIKFKTIKALFVILLLVSVAAEAGLIIWMKKS